MAGTGNPGATAFDPSGCRIPGITSHTEVSEHEASNIRKATAKYLGAKPGRRTARFTYDWCLKLHREMFGDVWKWAGEIRTAPVNFGVPHHQIRTMLYDLMQDLPAWSNCDMVEQAARLHCRAVNIHPFRDGNGRWSRMLANIWLKLHSHPIVAWPESIGLVESPIRNEYIAAIQDAIHNGREKPLIELHRRYTRQSEA
jgi:fido (protein-threonine AMPylation protein)